MQVSCHKNAVVGLGSALQLCVVFGSLREVVLAPVDSLMERARLRHARHLSYFKLDDDMPVFIINGSFVVPAVIFISFDFWMLSHSVVDPDPQGSENFCRIRIRNSRFWIRIRLGIRN
jgi:hypothetical protein